MRFLAGFILFLISLSFNKAKAYPDSLLLEVLHKKGNIEILTCPSSNPNWLSLDSSFAIAFKAIKELEKNLMYKMTDNIHLKFLSSLNDYNKFQLNHSSNQRIPYELSNDIFFPIYTSCEYFDLVKQIRYAVANQFINEYLFGISLKDKFQLVQQDDIPKWLYLGFCNYFSCGIQQSEFQKFLYFNKIKRFRNINNISSGNEQLFGTVLWYLFEKEKGKEINSAFWYLIKYANSFEKTFEYQFGIKFKYWLKDRISEIEKAQSPRIPKAELTFKPAEINGGIIMETSLDDNLNGLALSSNKFINEIYLIQNHNIQPILSISKFGLYPRLELNTPKILYTNHTAFVCFVDDNQWKLSEFAVSKSGESRLKSIKILNNTPINYKILKLINTKNGISILYRYMDSIFMYSIITKDSKLILKLDPSTQFEDYSEGKNDDYIFIKQRNIINGNVKIQIKGIAINSNLKTIYLDTLSEINDGINSLVVESANRLSFLKSKERFQSIDFLTLKDSATSIKSTNNKGLFYTQNLGYGNDNIVESFYYNGYWSLNRLTPNSELLEGDTFKLNYYSFDTVNIKNSTTKTKPNQAQDSLYFITDFDKSISIRPTKKNTFINLKILSHKFKDWLYLKELKFEFSNKDLNVPYNFNVPLTETYNSIVTPMLSGKIYSANQKQLLQFLTFTNVNRRRVGISAEHTFFYRKFEIQQAIIYRLRQYENRNELDLNRDRYFQYKAGILKKFDKFRMGVSANFISNQSINLLTSYRGTDYPIFNNYISGLILTAEYNPLQHSSNSTSRLKVYGQILPQFIVNNYLNNGGMNFSYANLAVQFYTKIGILEIASKLDAHYALGSQKMLCYIGGSNGLFSNSTYYSDDIKNRISKENHPMQLQTGFVRGFPIGSRAGSNSFVMQSDFDLTVFHLFRSRVIEKSFLKNFKVFSFVDLGTAFTGNTTADLSNSYNTKVYQTPNYILTVNAQRNPWLISTGLGVKFTIWDYHFRIENAHGYKENVWQLPITSISLGKNF